MRLKYNFISLVDFMREYYGESQSDREFATSEVREELDVLYEEISPVQPLEHEETSDSE